MARDYRRYTGEVKLAAAAVEPETVRVERQSNADLSEYINLLKMSVDKPVGDTGRGTTVGVNVNEPAVTLVKNRLRGAANQLGIGVSFGLLKRNDPRAAQYGLADGEVRLLFESRPKRAAPAKKAAGAVKKAATGLPSPSAARSRKAG